jgi:Concanavalin A-like lectin/glucanases superfamily/CotH kinase protein/Lamin Tail Domain/Immunoglobulin domain
MTYPLPFNRTSPARLRGIVFPALAGVMMVCNLTAFAASNVIISEIMARNDTVLADEDGDYQDWIEIYNRGGTTVNLLDWALTDNPANLVKWRFPETNLPPAGFMVVFASEKNRRVPGAPLHTNFKLSADGEYLALVEPDGATVATEFAPAFPPQLPDVSFGFGLETSSLTLVSNGTPARVLIPGDGGLGLDWTGTNFNDGAWLAAANGVGFDTGVPDPAEDSYADAVAGDAPVAWYRFGETSGFVAVNSGSAGSAVNASYLNMSLNHAGPRPPGFAGFEADNRAVLFNGFSGRVQIPDNPVFDFGTGAYAIELWFNPSNVGARGDLLTYKGPEGDYGIQVASQGANTLSVYHNTFIGTGGTLNNGTWYHLVVTRDAGGTVNTYLNGALLFSGTDTATMSISNDLLIGSNHTGSPASAALYFNGLIDEVAFYNRNLSESEAAAHYLQSQSGGASYTGLFGTDLETAMYGVNSSAYIRIPFQIEDAAAVDRMVLRLRYDDGFVAWINGQEIVSRNAPASLAWDSAAQDRHPDGAATVFEDFEVPDLDTLLVNGTNVLAIQGLNISVSNADFLAVAELVTLEAGTLGEQGRYFVEPTPGSFNGTGTADLGPILVDARQEPALPVKPLDGDDITVTARVAPSFSPLQSVTLHYRVMFGLISDEPMLDDGLHGDGAAGDGVYGAVIPAAVSSPGQMVRWYITAEDSLNRVSRWPLFGDPLNSPEYMGTVIANPAVTSALPIWEWFASSTSAANSRTGTRGALFLNGEFYDNVFIRARGGATSIPSQKFDFNTGYHCKVNAEVGRVEEANLNGSQSDPTLIRPPMAFETFLLAGIPATVAFPVLMRANGNADRVAYFVEQLDERFLDRWNLDREGALYKFVQRGSLTPIFTDPNDGVEKKTRLEEDRSDLQAVCTALQLTNNPAELTRRTAFLYDNFNLPALVNHLACRAVTLDADDVRKNIYLYRDTRGNGEWTILAWDKDWTFGITGDGGQFLRHPFFGDRAHRKDNALQWSLLYEAVFTDPQLSQMYLRRLRTVMDEQLQPPGVVNGSFESRVDAWYGPMMADRPAAASEVNNIKTVHIPQRRVDLYVTYAATNSSAAPANQLVPESQITYPGINFGAIEFNPASGNQAEEYIQLVNPNSTAIDVSGWKIRGAVSHTFLPGTVILATNVLYLSPDVAAFRGRSTGPSGGQSLLVQGNYQGQLSARGESLRLIDARGRTVVSTSYPGQPSLAQQSLRITEIMYHPVAPASGPYAAEDYEYLELKNTGTSVLDLNGVRLINGVAFDFTGSAVTSLDAGQTVLVVKNEDAFAQRYGAGLPVAGSYAGNLENRGERIQLVDASGEEILDFSYDNQWQPMTDGFGFSLVIRDESAPFNTWDQAESWRPSGRLNGSPAQTDPAQPAFAPIVINELLTHTDPPIVDQVELHNPAATNVDVGGWFLTDDFNTPRKYRIPDGTMIDAGGYLVFSEDQFNPTPGVPPSFSFSSKGDEAYLFAADAEGNLTGYFHGYEYGAAANGVTFGRYQTSTGEDHLVAQSAATLRGPNAGPKVGPVVLSEIMYHPPDGADGADNQRDEFVESYNGSGNPAPLYDAAAPTNTWQLDGAVQFAFPEDTTLEAGEYALVVGFDPLQAAELAAFRNTYGVPLAVRVFGPYHGKLDNSSETVKLLMPDTPEGSEVPMVLVDQVHYRDQSPWPSGADGAGVSLQRIHLDEYGNDPVNWTGGAPTPGTAYGGGQAPQLLSQPASQSVIAFNQLTLGVTASGDTPLRYRWRFNGDVIPNADSSSLNFPSILPEQAGEYSVVVYNDAGSAASSNAVLIVNIAVLVTVQPQDQSARPGEPASFHVEATSSSPISYQWRKDGVLILGATGPTLALSGVEREDDGYYDVVLTDAVGTVVSEAARLAVLIDPVVLQAPLSQSVVEGGTLTLSVLSDGTLPMSYRWRRGSISLTNVTLDSNLGFFTLTNVQLSDAGNYEVILTNAAFYTPGVRSRPAAVVTVLADSDGDGLPDLWETDHGLNPNDGSDAARDDDGDGLTNKEEYQTGTDPADPESFLKVDRIEVEGAATVFFGAISNLTYTVEYQEAVGNGTWSRLADVIARPENRVEQIVDSASDPARFYRVVTPRKP